jgi:hypothetical protein
MIVLVIDKTTINPKRKCLLIIVSKIPILPKYNEVTRHLNIFQIK